MPATAFAPAKVNLFLHVGAPAADGFPIGTPAGMPSSMTWHSVAHLVARSVILSLALVRAGRCLARPIRLPI